MLPGENQTGRLPKNCYVHTVNCNVITPSRQQLRYFLFSQSLADGIRISLEIATPVIVFAQLGQIGIGLTMATGALCASICDIPGAMESKRDGMLYCIAFIFGMPVLTGFLNQNPFTLGLLIAVSCFFFSMLSVYG